MTQVNNVPFIDILIFAVIAVLLVLRLRSVLGQKTGYEDQSRGKETAERFEQKPIPIRPDVQAAANDGHGMDALRRAEPSFSEAQFLDGAKAAFGIILSAYAEGDMAQLKRLLSYDLLQSFTQSIQQRASDGEALSITIEDISHVSILNAQVFDNIASVTVDFHSTQTRMITDEGGNVIDDEGTGKLELVDIWTFERDLTLSDPNWKLAETESPEDEA
ncbi:MAG: Tim44 domain-containing protein [SAR116 cluster bacterium]|nr:MAG: Tim44 domain-containing protein [SAR116 cluster bacterium]